MARRNYYSRLVGGLKVVLPIAALALLSTLFLLSDPPDPDRALPYAEVDVAQLARELRLTEPRLAGVLPDGREVTLVAAAAAPDFETTNVIVTDRIEGRIAMTDGAFILLDAGSGRIDVEGRIADLSGGVQAETTQGYTIRSDALRLSLADLGIDAPQAVRLEGPGLTLDAGAMVLGGPSGEAVLSFTGGVRLLYEASEQDP
jgi:lipopolysaccharide export system protein LptC